MTNKRIQHVSRVPSETFSHYKGNGWYGKQAKAAGSGCLMQICLVPFLLLWRLVKGARR